MLRSPRQIRTVTAVGAAAVVALAVPAAAMPSFHAPALGIEALSPYQPQTLCNSMTAKPGVVAFERLVLRSFPGTVSDGIVNSCAAEGMTSEHAEGRAWDWGGLNAAKATDRAKVSALTRWLFATDSAGHSFALARRLGVMYVIWNHKIWGSYAAGQGWRAYAGSNPHSDHVHFSFSWAGALKRTSFWTGRPSQVLYGPTGSMVPPVQRPAPTPAPAGSPGPVSTGLPTATPGQVSAEPPASTPTGTTGPTSSATPTGDGYPASDGAWPDPRAWESLRQQWAARQRY